MLILLSAVASHYSPLQTWRVRVPDAHASPGLAETIRDLVQTRKRFANAPHLVGLRTNNQILTSRSAGKISQPITALELAPRLQRTVRTTTRVNPINFRGPANEVTATTSPLPPSAVSGDNVLSGVRTLINILITALSKTDFCPRQCGDRDHKNSNPVQ